MSARTAASALLLTLLTAEVTACGAGAPSADLQLPEGFPAEFPIPAEAQQASTGDAVVLRVPDTTAAELEAFYRDSLPEDGWEVVDGWEGVDPDDRVTTGLVIEQDGATGAIAFIAEAGGVVVRINLSQPQYEPQPSG